jgi:hypothetical protein
MTFLQEPRSHGKSFDEPGQRDLLMGNLREAATRSRLTTTIFENVGNALRMKRISCTDAIERLKQEDLLHLLPGARP